MPDFQRISILSKAHAGVLEGNYARKAIAQEVLCAALWWSILHKDSKAYYNACDECHRKGRSSWMDELPLDLQVSL